MSSSLLPEPQILVPVSLAATLGLEQAVLLHCLGDCLRHRATEWRDGYRWLTLGESALSELFPFWTLEQLDNVARKLEAQGLVRLAGGELALSKQLVVAFNETSAAPAAAPETAPSPQPASARPDWHPPVESAARAIDDWYPSAELYGKIEQLHGCPREFIEQHAAEFRLYWRDSGETDSSWDGRFEARVSQAWRQQQATQTGAARADSRPGGFQPRAVVNTPLAANWRPSEDAIQILRRTGVTESFIEDAIPEFVLYWRDRGVALKTWNSKFIAHIRRQWARYSAAIEHDSEPRLLPADWQPSEDVFDILAMANIDRDFALQQLPEFMLFWQENKQMLASWNSKFLQHVKYQWAQQHQINRDSNGGQAGPATGQGSTRSRSISDDLIDTNW